MGHVVKTRGASMHDPRLMVYFYLDVVEWGEDREGRVLRFSIKIKNIYTNNIPPRDLRSNDLT